jgi:hypothetical protein
VLDVAHCLTQPAARVWQACEGGGGTLDEITDAVVAQSSGELNNRGDATAIVERALAELERKRLLEPAADGVSRRQALLRIGAVGAGALAAPLIVSAAVPKSAEAFKSPATCAPFGKACNVNGGQANSYGSSTTNVCCGPGVTGPGGTTKCNTAVGTGPGGCYCDQLNVCANCVKTGVNPSASNCGDGTCTGLQVGAQNRCCCSAKCNGANACE